MLEGIYKLIIKVEALHSYRNWSFLEITRNVRNNFSLEFFFKFLYNLAITKNKQALRLYSKAVVPVLIIYWSYCWRCHFRSSYFICLLWFLMPGYENGILILLSYKLEILENYPANVVYLSVPLRNKRIFSLLIGHYPIWGETKLLASLDGQFLLIISAHLVDLIFFFEKPLLQIPIFVCNVQTWFSDFYHIE